jgi:hypothetical protein
MYSGFLGGHQVMKLSQDDQISLNRALEEIEVRMVQKFARNCAKI